MKRDELEHVLRAAASRKLITITAVRGGWPHVDIFSAEDELVAAGLENWLGEVKSGGGAG